MDFHGQLLKSVKSEKIILPTINYRDSQVEDPSQHLLVYITPGLLAILIRLRFLLGKPGPQHRADDLQTFWRDVIGRVGGREPVLVVNIYDIHGWYTSLNERDMVVQNVIFNLRNKNVLIPKLCGRVPDRITKLSIGITIHVKC